MAAYRLVVSLVLSSSFPLLGVGSGSSSLRSSTIALTRDGRVVAVNPDSDSVSIVDPGLGTPVSEVEVGREPGTVAVDPNAGRAYVTLRGEHSVAVVDLENARVLARFAAGSRPFGTLADANGRLWVSTELSHSLRVLDSSSGELIDEIPTEPRPRGMALTADGSQLLVTHFLTGKVSVIGVEKLSIERVIETGSDSNLAQSLVIDPATSRAFLPHTRSRSSEPALLFDTTVFPVVSVLDLDQGRHLLAERIPLDIADRPVNLPIDATLNAERKLYVVNAGSNDVSVVDLETGLATAHLEVGDNPRGIVFDTERARAYVNNTLSGSISVIDTLAEAVVGEIPVTEIPLPPEVLNGKILFNSSDRPDLARDQWISCAVCHPDGRHDGRTWFFADGPRNTPSLLGVGETLPIHWSGDLDELQDTESTVRRIQAGTGLVAGPENCDPACDQAPPNRGRSQDLDDLAAFMTTLRVPPSPALLADGSLSPGAARGQALFQSTEIGCAECHPAPLYTDLGKHDVGTGSRLLEAKGTDFDTPSLRGVRDTSPYLHNGAAATLLDVLATANPGDLHGRTSHLDDDQLRDLAEFLLALPFENAKLSCLPDGATLCLGGSRFRARAAWWTPLGERQDAGASPLSDDTGTFWFFQPDNVELVVKVLDACDLSDRFWVFAAGLTNLEVEITLTDTATAEVRTYRSPPTSAFQPIQDTAAFATCAEPR